MPGKGHLGVHLKKKRVKNTRAKGGTFNSQNRMIAPDAGELYFMISAADNPTKTFRLGTRQKGGFQAERGKVGYVRNKTPFKGLSEVV